MFSAGRHLDVRAEERVAGGQLGDRRSIRDPESGVVPRCGWQVHEATVGGLRRGHPDRGELGVKEQGLVLVAVHRRRDEMAAGPVQGVGDGVREHRVGADLDEGVIGAAGAANGMGDGLVESHRVAQVGRPIVGIHHRWEFSSMGRVVLMIGMLGGWGAKSASALRNSGSIGSMIG